MKPNKHPLNFFIFCLLLLVGCDNVVPGIEANDVPDFVRLTSYHKSFKADGGRFQVMIASSSDWTLAPQEDYSWVKADAETGHSGDVITFRVEPNASEEELSAQFVFVSGKAEAVLEFTVEAKEVEEPIEPSGPLVKLAAQMKGSRLFPKWEGGPLGTCSELTVEMLFRPDALTKQISTMFGVEGYLLLRIGDANYPSDQLQISSRGGKYPVVTMYPEYPVPDFVPDRWYHLALVFDHGKMTIFIDGKPCFDATFYQTTIDYSPQWSYENGGGRCFWFGYSYDESRDFHGLMTEMRIWKKALTYDEFNAPGHFYSVDPKASGLYSYWKFDKEASDEDRIDDLTGNGNSLYGETNVLKQGTGEVYGYPGINFVEVALPQSEN